MESLLTKIKLAHHDKRGYPHALYECICGKQKVIMQYSVESGNTKSCGCLKKEIGSRSRTHGMARTRFYAIHQNMMNRCYNKNTSSYTKYGARGIEVCERWHVFANFYDDMFATYQDNSTIERNENDGPYSPSNCKWATRQEQAWNRRSSKLIEFKGKKQCIGAWADELGMRQETLWARFNRGWSAKRALA